MYLFQFDIYPTHFEIPCLVPVGVVVLASHFPSLLPVRCCDGEEEIKSSDVIVLIAFFPLGGGGGNTPRTMDRVEAAALANCGMRERGL